MRIGTVLFVLLAPLTIHAAAATDTDSVAFSTTLPCIVGDTFVLGASETVPGCSFTHSGSFHVDSCAASSCQATLTLHDEGDGLLPGVQSVQTTVDDDASGGSLVACSASAPSIDGTLTCDSISTITLALPTGCRLITLETAGTLDIRVAGADIADTFRVCSDGTTNTVAQA